MAEHNVTPHLYTRRQVLIERTHCPMKISIYLQIYDLFPFCLCRWYRTPQPTRSNTSNNHYANKNKNYEKKKQLLLF